VVQLWIYWTADTRRVLTTAAGQSVPNKAIELLQLTSIGNVVELLSTVVIKFALVRLAGRVRAEADHLVDHLVHLDGCTQILSDLRIPRDQHVPRNVHELVQELEVFLETSVVLEDECRALMRCQPLLFEAGRAGTDVGYSRGNGPAEQDPYAHVLREGIPGSSVRSWVRQAADLTYLTSWRLCVFSNVRCTMVLTLAEVSGPIGGSPL
jgi:hypothetical protein